jgi:hypothetical protein
VVVNGRKVQKVQFLPDVNRTNRSLYCTVCTTAGRAAADRRGIVMHCQWFVQALLKTLNKRKWQMAPSSLSQLAYLPDEVLSIIISKAKDPHSLTATCRSLLAAAQGIHTQAQWWHQHQRKKTLFRIFRWKWLQKASLSLSELHNFLKLILMKRSEDYQSNWHGVFAVARAAVILDLPQTLSLLLTKGLVLHQRVLVADIIVLDRLEMLGLMQQQVGLSGSNESLDAGKWTEDMRKVASWLSNTPLSELEQRPSIDDLQEPVHQPNEAEVPEWELESASSKVSDAGLSLSDLTRRQGQSEEIAEHDMTKDEHREVSYMSFLDFTEDLVRLDRSWYEVDVEDIGVDMLNHGVGRFAGEACMRKLEKSIFSACRAGMGAAFVKWLLPLLKANSRWEKVLLRIIHTAHDEPDLDDEALDVLESATSESFPRCAFALRFLRGQASKLDIQEGSRGLRGFECATLLEWELNRGLYSIMEDTDEDNIRKAMWHWLCRQRPNGLTGMKSVYPALVAVLNSGMWFGASIRRDGYIEEVDVYWYKLAAKEFRKALELMFGLQ